MFLVLLYVMGNPREQCLDLSKYLGMDWAQCLNLLAEKSLNLKIQRLLVKSSSAI